ncbi:MAG: hypothetical protein ACPG19_14315 [Saprospiraceae bacterium]
MISLIVIAGVLITSLALFGMIAKGGYTYLTNYRPSVKKIAADVKKMQGLMASTASKLVPWTVEEMSLLSLDEVDRVKKKRITTVVQGTLTSIYQEPMVTYAYKRYASKKENALIFARSSNRSFEYRIKDGAIQIKVNNKHIGELRTNGVLYQNKRMLARINQSIEGYNPILLLNRQGEMKELGHVADKKSKEVINPRALQLVDNKMNSDEESVFLSLALLDIIYKSVKK